jgi:hypothetical protein
MLNENGTKLNAKSKSTQTRCKNPAVSGSTKCRLHGGKSLKGHESPQFKTGAHSKYLPTRLAAIYEDIEADLEVNILSRNLKLREMFLREKLEMLDDAPDSAKAWSELRDIADEMHKAFENDNLGMVQVSLMQLDRLINNMEAYHMAVDEIRRDLSEQRKDSQAKAGITAKSENSVTVPELMAFMGAFLGAIAQIVSNPRELQEIENAAIRLTSVKESSSSQLIAIEQSKD